jgi:hypothetical protein
MKKRIRKKLHKRYIHDVVYEVSVSDVWRERLFKTKYGWVGRETADQLPPYLARVIHQYNLKYKVLVEQEEEVWLFVFQSAEFNDVHEVSWNSFRSSP